MQQKIQLLEQQLASGKEENESLRKELADAKAPARRRQSEIDADNFDVEAVVKGLDVSAIVVKVEDFIHINNFGEKEITPPPVSTL